jgi:hypothetical protein
VADFPRFEYSMKAVVRAGDVIKDEVQWSEDRRRELLEVFSIANNWREAHAYPMFRMRHELIGRMRGAKVPGLTVARLKRMPSIRKKLRKIPHKLNQIQDIAGCRAVLPSIADARRLVSHLRDTSNHEFNKTEKTITSQLLKPVAIEATT